MAKTVADLMNQFGGISFGPAAGYVTTVGMPVESHEPRLMVVSLVMEPAEVEIVDGKLVYRKEVIARDTKEAMERLGVEVR